jgi:hypothetical protein
VNTWSVLAAVHEGRPVARGFEKWFETDPFTSWKKL